MKDYNSSHPDFKTAILWFGFFKKNKFMIFFCSPPQIAQRGCLMYTLTVDSHKLGRSTDRPSPTDRHPISNSLYLVAHSTFHQLSDQLTSINQSSAPVL